LTNRPCRKTEMPPMKIRVGFDFVYEFVAPTPMVLMLNVHPSRVKDLIRRINCAFRRRCR
jgi:hypothetical protein